jgi:hypothetical protein
MSSYLDPKGHVVVEQPIKLEPGKIVSGHGTTIRFPERREPLVFGPELVPYVNKFSDPVSVNDVVDKVVEMATKRISDIPIVAPTAANDDANPKNAMGAKKPNLALVPSAAMLHMAHAFMNGAAKYGPYNWREKKVELMTYVAAAQRHLASFLDGEEKAGDSGVHHLGHALASIAIMLDAIETGNAIDNRPAVGRAGAMIEAFNDNGTF